MAQHQRSPVARTLRGISIFRDIPPSALAAIENRCSWRTYAPQEQIIDYLDRSEDVFFIVSGQARASIYSARGKLVTFSDLGAGAAFGEYAALDGAPRSAGIEAHGYCTVASMPGPAFQQIAVSEPTVALALLHAVNRHAILTP
jgi:CRP-like cAMP-binding protein